MVVSFERCRDTQILLSCLKDMNSKYKSNYVGDEDEGTPLLTKANMENQKAQLLQQKMKKQQ